MSSHLKHPRHEASTKMGFNTRLAVWISNLVMTMPFFYFCVLLTFSAVVLPAFLQQILFVSNGIQLTMLPLLGVSAAVGAIAGAALMNFIYKHSVRSELRMTALMKHVGMSEEDIAAVDSAADLEISREMRSQ